MCLLYIAPIQSITMCFAYTPPDGYAAMKQDMCMPNVDKMNFSCIANADQLYALFQNTPTADRRFDWTTVSFVLFHMHIHVATSSNSSNTSNHLEDKCCETSDTQDTCSTTAVYSRRIYQNFPLLLVDVFQISGVGSNVLNYYTSGDYRLWLSSTLPEICWTPPLPFCTSKYYTGILSDFLYQVKTQCKHAVK